MWQFGIGFVFGAFLGSLSFCIATRSLINESFWGRSYCENCKKQLKWYDLFPMFSYLILRGRCRFCKKKLSSEYLIVELGVAILVGLLFYLSLPQDFSIFVEKFTTASFLLPIYIAELIFKSLVICVLVAIVATDFKKGLIPDRITYPAIISSLFYLVVLSVYKVILLYLSLNQSALGRYLLPPHSNYFFSHSLILIAPLQNGVTAAIVLAFFFGLLILITKGRGMGGGDLKLGIFMGLVLSLPEALLALMLAFITGSVVGIGLIIFGKKKLGQTIPFGPFLALGSLITLFWGQVILNWYLHLKLV